MSKKKNDPAALATIMLQKKLSEWRDGAEPVWPSTWPIFERLIARQLELAPVWQELWAKDVNGIPLWNLTEQCIFASMSGEKGEHNQLRTDYRELQALNTNIADVYNKRAVGFGTEEYQLVIIGMRAEDQRNDLMRKISGPESL